MSTPTRFPLVTRCVLLTLSVVSLTLTCATHALDLSHTCLHGHPLRLWRGRWLGPRQIPAFTAARAFLVMAFVFLITFVVLVGVLIAIEVSKHANRYYYFYREAEEDSVRERKDQTVHHAEDEPAADSTGASVDPHRGQCSRTVTPLEQQQQQQQMQPSSSAHTGPHTHNERKEPPFVVNKNGQHNSVDVHDQDETRTPQTFEELETRVFCIPWEKGIATAALSFLVFVLTSHVISAGTLASYLAANATGHVGPAYWCLIVAVVLDAVCVVCLTAKQLSGVDFASGCGGDGDYDRDDYYFPRGGHRWSDAVTPPHHTARPYDDGGVAMRPVRPTDESLADRRGSGHDAHHRLVYVPTHLDV